MAKTLNKNQRQRQALMRLVIMAAILICLNILASYFHSGLDLTKEKRFTLSKPTTELLRNMKETAVVDVYLKGKFPAELQRLQEAVRERLRSFKDISGNKVIFQFIDPFEGKTTDEQKAIAHDLSNKGIYFQELNVKDDEEYSMKPFFPYALVQYNNKEMPVMLLENPPGATPAEKISMAEATMEYKFANAINQLGRPAKARIGYISGNGEPLSIHSYDMLSTLGHYYSMDTIDLTHTRNISNAYDAIIINEPVLPFTGPEKLTIDQYMVRGGHILWDVNTMNATMDSLSSSQFISQSNNLDLDDILFKYGVRINNDLVEDEEMNMPMPLMIANGTPELHPWVYYPRLNPTSDNPIVKNMGFVMGHFCNTIDTIRTRLIKKTVLLHTSQHTLNPRSPVRVSLSMMTYPLKPETFTKSYLPVAMLLEGKFVSAYDHILAPEFLRYLADSAHAPFKAVCDTDNSMIVVSGGDMFWNDYTTKDGVFPVGYHRYSQEFLANKDFLLNCVEYLTDQSGILEARSKEVKLRLLDTVRAKDEKTKWQVVNVAIPIGIVLVFASAYFFFRKRRYEVKQKPSKPTANA